MRLYTVYFLVAALSVLTFHDPTWSADCNGNGQDDRLVDIELGASEDCNHDGIPDECESGAPGLHSTTSFRSDDVVRDLIVTDINGDGHPDIATIELGSSDESSFVNAYLSDGNGTFAYQRLLSMRTTLCCLDSADLNDDGRADVTAVSSSRDTSNVIVVGYLRGNPPAATVVGTSIAGAVGDYALGDLNGDDQPEFVVSTLDGDLEVWSANADGSLVQIAERIGEAKRSVRVADLDNDGALDILTFSQKSLAVYLNPGDGTLGPREIWFNNQAAELDFLHSVVVDFDNDNFSDIVTGDVHGIWVLRNINGSRLGDPVKTFVNSTNSGITALATADFNRDGTTDLVTGFSKSHQAMATLINDGSGTLTHGLFYQSPWPEFIVAADLGGDGFSDIVRGPVRDTNNIAVFWTDPIDGSPVVTAQEAERLFPLYEQERLPIIEPHSPGLKDIDADGDLDILAIDGEDTVRILRNDNGNFPTREEVRIIGAFEMFTMVLDDFDGDGSQDIATTDESTEFLHVLYNNGAGLYETVEHIQGNSTSRFITSGDLSGDERPDIVTRSRTGVSVYINIGATFDPPIVKSTDGAPNAAAIGDLNGDGWNDLVLAFRAAEFIMLMLNDGQGDLRSQTRFDAQDPTDLMLLDVDLDGDLDVVSAAGSRNGFTILDNDGLGQLELAAFHEVSMNVATIQPVDLNGDEYLDVLTADGRGFLTISTNLGNGQFASSARLFSGEDTRFARAGDVDGDGDTDLIGFNHGSGQGKGDITLFRHVISPPPITTFLTEVCTESDFERISIRESQSPIIERISKFIVPADPSDATLLPPAFQDVNVYGFHQEFLKNEFRDLFPALNEAIYEQLTGRRATRKYFVGNLNRLRLGTNVEYGFSVLASYHADRSELPTPVEVLNVYETLRQHFLLEPLTYFPDESVTREDAAGWPTDPGFPVLLDDSVSKSTYQTYTIATNIGRVRLMTIDEFEQANARGLISFQDIFVVDRAPRDIEGVFGGLITAEPQGALSHLALRTARRGTPNAYVADAFEAFASFDGQLVRLSVGTEKYRVLPATQEQADQWWEDSRPRVSELPGTDAEYQGLDGVAEIDLLGNVPPEARFGGKASNFARLQRLFTGEFDPYRAVGFGIPVHYYVEFMRSNRITSIVDPGALVTYEAFIEETLAWSEFRTNSSVRFAALDNFRRHMNDFGAVPQNLVVQIGERIDEVFGPSMERVRFRSSSNAEDALEFNGAGLYESTAGCVADDRDGDSTGPSICDPSKNNERGIARALKRVWASQWNFRAYEEREFFSIPHRETAMGILVSQAFPDEQVNGVILTGDLADNRENRFVISAQLGDRSVVDPEPGEFPERDLLRIEDGEVVEILRVLPSSLVGPGEVVLSDDQLREIGRVVAHVDEHFPIELGDRSRDDVLLDLEFKIDSDGKLAIKQVRPFLRVTDSIPRPTLTIEIKDDAQACSVFIQALSPLDVYQRKSSVRLIPGTYRIPTTVNEFQVPLFGKVLVGPDRTPATPVGIGTFRISDTTLDGETTFHLRYEQDFTVPGNPIVDFQLRIVNMTFRFGGGVAETTRTIDASSLDSTIAIEGSLDGAALNYASCSHETLSQFELVVVLGGGQFISLIERHEPPLSSTETGPASLQRAELHLTWIDEAVEDYWQLVYSAFRHNRGERYWIVFDEAHNVPDIPRPVKAIEIVTDEPTIDQRQVVLYLDESFEITGALFPVSFNRRELAPVLLRRGDVNADGGHDITDPFLVLNFLFLEGDRFVCDKAVDANDDGSVNLADALVIFGHLFSGHPRIKAPFDSCGVDPTEDGLSCGAFPACEG
jgi:hypothetical protein